MAVSVMEVLALIRCSVTIIILSAPVSTDSQRWKKMPISEIAFITEEVKRKLIMVITAIRPR